MKIQYETVEKEVEDLPKGQKVMNDKTKKDKTKTESPDMEKPHTKLKQQSMKEYFNDKKMMDWNLKKKDYLN